MLLKRTPTQSSPAPKSPAFKYFSSLKLWIVVTILQTYVDDSLISKPVFYSFGENAYNTYAIFASVSQYMFGCFHWWLCTTGEWEYVNWNMHRKTFKFNVEKPKRLIKYI